MRMMIELKDVEKVYKTDHVETMALADMTLAVPQGEFLGIMGPSGCGKSTLLNILGLLDSPSRGEYLLAGESVAGLSEDKMAKHRKSHVGIVFQSFNLIDELSVAENVALPLLYRGIGKKEREAAVASVMERVGIAHRAKHMPRQLSGGQQQRAAIARAVVGKPRLLLADEPTGNLDSAHGREVMELLKGLNTEGVTVVMVTHSQHDAGYAHRVVELLDGRVAKERRAALREANEELAAAV